MVKIVYQDIRETINSVISWKVTPEINSLIFRSMRYAGFMTILGFVLVTARNYIGQNINCYSPSMNKEETKAVESYCFIASTFTLTNLTVPANSPHPGLGPIPSKEFFPPGTKDITAEEGGTDDGTVRHAYYQWVSLMLAIQSCLLYLPCLLWESHEKGYLDKLLNDTHTVVVDSKAARKKLAESARHFDYTKNHSNRKYLVWYFICEVLAVAIAITNLFLTNTFMGGRFFSYGENALKYLRSSATDANNPLNQMFPKVGKCTFYIFGPSGTIQNKDAICVLPLNIVNEKIYVLLWLVYIILAILTAVALLLHLIHFLIPRLVRSTIVARCGSEMARNSTRRVMKDFSVADLFILFKLQPYVVDFPVWIEELHKIMYDKQD